jgi:hypothetical protein
MSDPEYVVVNARGGAEATSSPFVRRVPWAACG